MTLSSDSVAQLVAAIKLAMITIPPTEPDTEVSTPAEAQLPQPPAPPIVIPAPEALVELVDWAVYIPRRTHTERDYYYNKLYSKFNQVNGDNVFQLSRTKRNIMVRENRQVIFRCLRDDSHARNLYLEFHDCKYLCSDWKEKFLGGHSLDYRNLETPPEYSVYD